MLTRTHVRTIGPPCQKAGETESCCCITGQSGFEVAEAEMPRTVDTISRSHRVNQIRCSELQIVSGYGPAKIRIDRYYGFRLMICPGKGIPETSEQRNVSLGSCPRKCTRQSRLGGPVAPAGLAKMSLMNLLAPTRKLRTLLEPIVVV